MGSAAFGGWLVTNSSDVEGHPNRRIGHPFAAPQIAACKQRGTNPLERRGASPAFLEWVIFLRIPSDGTMTIVDSVTPAITR